MSKNKTKIVQLQKGQIGRREKGGIIGMGRKRDGRKRE